MRGGIFLSKKAESHRQYHLFQSYVIYCKRWVNKGSETLVGTFFGDCISLAFSKPRERILSRVPLHIRKVWKVLLCLRLGTRNMERGTRDEGAKKRLSPWGHCETSKQSNGEFSTRNAIQKHVQKSHFLGGWFWLNDAVWRSWIRTGETFCCLVIFVHFNPLMYYFVISYKFS